MLNVSIKKVIDDFTLEVQHSWPAGCHVVFGVNGCGKSTLLRCIAGFSCINSGEIALNETIWQSRDVFVPPHRRGIGWIGQKSLLFPHLTVQQNIQLAKQHQHSPHTLDSVILKALDITPILYRQPETLSSGEAQRAALAMTLINNPSVMLLDEAFSHLDVFSSTIIRNQLKPLFKRLDIPVILVSHHIQDIETLADSVCWLEHGHLKMHGSATTVLQHIQAQLAQT